MALHSKFFEGQTPPPVPIESYENIEWYNEQIDRIWNGLDYKGTRITGDHYWLLNFFPMNRVKVDKRGRATDEFDFHYGYFSQEDDYFFKQVEEARQDGMDIMLFTGRGFGKCLDPDTLVRMADGSLKRAADIVVGDQVMGPDSTPRNVLHTYSGIDDMYEIQQHGGMTYRVNSQHILSLKRKNGVHCSEIVKGKKKNYLRYPQYGEVANIPVQEVKAKSAKFFSAFSGYKAPIEFPFRKVELDAYFLGLWLGDGGSKRASVTTEDVEVREYLYAFAKEHGLEINVNDSNGERCPTYILTAGIATKGRRRDANPVMRMLRRLGVLNGKFIPKDYLRNDRETRLQLLAGLIDSDGHMAGNCYEITQKNQKLAYDIYNLCNTLGFRTSVKAVTKRIKETGFEATYWRVSFSGYTDDIPVKLERKKTAVKKNKNPYLTGIKSIENVGKGQYNGFTIDGDNLFLLEDGTVTHNTYNVIAIGAKLYVLMDNAHLIISASIKDHADPTMAKMREGLNGLEKFHPTLAQKRLFDNEGAIQAGEILNREGRVITTGSLNLIEKIVYDKKPGKTKGRRLNWQHFEEVGDWSGAASLVDCIGASEGTWYVGSIKKAQVFYTGTGGTVTSLQAKQIFLDPGAFNIYSVRQYKDRPHAFFFPAYLKYGGFWESDGVSDAVGAKEDLEAKRKSMEGNQQKLQKHMQEYPFTIDEMFMLTGTNRFRQQIINKQITKLEALPKNELPGERGFLHWKRKHGKIVGVEWEKKDDGDLWILEHPMINPETGKAFSHLYVAGYDGIDVGEKDTATGKGSCGAISVKKRMFSMKDLNNAYVCYYMKRPEDIDELYETCLMISWYFNTLINIENSKVGIVGYFKQRDQLNRLMKRPKITLNDPTSDKESNLIGTTPTLKNFGYGEDFLAQHLKDYGDTYLYLPVLYQMRDFRMDQRTYFDFIMSKFMCELGDDELSDKMVVPVKKNQEFEEEGWYTDENGFKRFGTLPKASKYEKEFNFEDNISTFININ